MFEFDKNLTVESLDSVPSEYKGLYVEADQDGKKVYTVSDTVKGLVDAYVGTTKALNTARGDLKKANDESASRRVTKKSVIEFAKNLGLEEVDEDEPLNALKSHVDSLVQQVKGGQEVKVNLDKIRAEADRRVNEVKQEADGRITKMQGALERYLIDQAATAALAESKGSVKLLLPHVKSHTKVIAEGDDYVVRVVDGDGELRMNGKGGYMSVQDLVAEMKTKEEFGRAFDSETPAGTGARPNAANRPAPRNQEPKSSIDKISAGLKAGGYNRGRG